MAWVPLAQAETTAVEEELFEAAEEQEKDETDVVKDLFAEEEEPDTTEDTAGFLEEDEEPYLEEHPFAQYLDYTQGFSYFRVTVADKPKVELLLSKPVHPQGDVSGRGSVGSLPDKKEGRAFRQIPGGCHPQVGPAVSKAGGPFHPDQKGRKDILQGIGRQHR